MKTINKFLTVFCALCASSAFAGTPQLSDITCAELAEKFEPTADARARFADLKGSCEGVYTIDGALYAQTTAVVRRKTGARFTLYLPATDHTFSVVPDKDARIRVGRRDLRPRDLNRGDEINIFLSVDKLATAKVDTIAFATQPEDYEVITEHPVEPVAALPTTG